MNWQRYIKVFYMVLCCSYTETHTEVFVSQKLDKQYRLKRLTNRWEKVISALRWWWKSYHDREKVDICFLSWHWLMIVIVACGRITSKWLKLQMKLKGNVLWITNTAVWEVQRMKAWSVTFLPLSFMQLSFLRFCFLWSTICLKRS